MGYDLLVGDRERKILYSSLFFWQKRNFDVSITINFGWRAKQGNIAEIKNDVELKDMIYTFRARGGLNENMYGKAAKQRTKSILFTGDWVLIGDAQGSREEAHLQFRKFHFCSFLVNKFWHLFSHCGCPCFQHLKCEPITNDSYWHINRGCLYCHLVTFLSTEAI